MSKAAATIDTLIGQIAEQYRNVPYVKGRDLAFREALSHYNLPGGFARKGKVALRFVEALKVNQLTAEEHP